MHPKLEFASTVWNPYHQKDIQATEMVQCRAVRFTYERYANVKTIISQLQLESLQERRSKGLVLSWFIKSLQITLFTT